MSMLDKFKQDRADKKARKEAARGNYRFFVGGLEIDVAKMTSGVEKLVRIALDREVAKIIKKHGDLVHPETGERAEFHFISPRLDGKDIQLRIVTDSQQMRDWLAAKGLAVHGEEVGGVPVAAVSGAAEPAEA